MYVCILVLFIDIGPIGANGNMGALRTMGTIGPNRTKITNRTNSPIGLGQKAQNHINTQVQWFGRPKAHNLHKCNGLGVRRLRRLIIIIRYNGLEGPVARNLINTIVWRSKAQNHYKYNGLGSPRLRHFINTIVCRSKGSESL